MKDAGHNELEVGDTVTYIAQKRLEYGKVISISKLKVKIECIKWKVRNIEYDKYSMSPGYTAFYFPEFVLKYKEQV